MAEVLTQTVEPPVEKPSENDLSDDLCEPNKKKLKLEDAEAKTKPKLEDRLCTVLCCAVCLDLPNLAVYQVC